MATAQATLTPITDTTPAVVEISAKEPSGAQWVSRYPTSKAVSACTEPFAQNLSAFIAALKAAGATVTISATYRPPERAYLMHWCYMISNEDQDPRTVPEKAGVNILWDHRDDAGSYDKPSSIQAARAMLNAYGMQNLQTPPALNTRHTLGLAVDMSITWESDLTIQKADTSVVTITSTPRSGMNSDLREIGASYGVVKFVGGAADKPHWSDNGH